jgi:hypothetical protein
MPDANAFFYYQCESRTVTTPRGSTVGPALPAGTDWSGLMDASQNKPWFVKSPQDVGSGQGYTQVPLSAMYGAAQRIGFPAELVDGWFNTTASL